MNKYKGFKEGDHIIFNSNNNSTWKIISYNKKQSIQFVELIKGSFNGETKGYSSTGIVTEFTCTVVQRSYSIKPYYPDWF